MSKTFSVLWVITTFLLGFAFSGYAQTEESPQNITDGVETVRNVYQIFPAGKQGNSVYKNKTLIATTPDLILSDALEVLETEIYFGVSSAGEPELRAVGEEIIFSAKGGGFYHLKTKAGFTKVVRVNPQQKIQVLLPRSKTAADLVYNQVNKAAFSHITKGESIETEDGKLRYQYTFKIHHIKASDQDITTLPTLIENFSASIHLKWLSQNQLQYKLSNGQTHTIKIK